jgi:cytochrome P450
MLIKALSRGAILRAEPTVRAICSELIDGFAADGKVDLVSAYAVPAPVMALRVFLGVDSDRTADFGRWAKALNSATGHVLSDDELRESTEAQLEFLDFLESEVADRKLDPGDDILSMLLDAGREEAEHPLTMDEITALATQFVAAGSDTTSNLIGMGMYQLASDAELMGKVSGNPALIRPFVEESLRLESPVQGMYRIATQDTVLNEVEIPAGKYVYMLYAAANRDPSTYEDAEGYRLDRSKSAHYAFGRGPHTCIGASLARTVAYIAFETLLARVTDIKLADPSAGADINVGSYILRGPNSLQLTFRPV